MSVEEDAAAGANATRGPRLSMEALSFLEANERELTMHPITLTFRSSGAALLALLHRAPSGCAGPLRQVACAVSLRMGVTLRGFRAAGGSSALGLVRPCLPLLATLPKVCAPLVLCTRHVCFLQPIMRKAGHSPGRAPGGGGAAACADCAAERLELSGDVHIARVVCRHTARLRLATMSTWLSRVQLA